MENKHNFFFSFKFVLLISLLSSKVLCDFVMQVESIIVRKPYDHLSNINCTLDIVAFPTEDEIDVNFPNLMEKYKPEREKCINLNFIQVRVFCPDETEAAFDEEYKGLPTTEKPYIVDRFISENGDEVKCKSFNTKEYTAKVTLDHHGKKDKMTVTITFVKDKNRSSFMALSI